MLYTLKQLTESFAVLPIDTVEELENTVDLVFEKVIINCITQNID